MRSIVLFVLPALIARVAASVAQGAPPFTAAAFRGMISDLAFSALVGLIVAPLLKRRPVYGAIWGGWCLVIALNFEHVKVNAANLDVTLIELALTKEVFLGSALSLSVLLTFVFVAAAVLGVVWFAGERLRPESTRGTWIVVVVLVLATAVAPLSPAAPRWMQLGVLEANLVRAPLRLLSGPQPLPTGQLERFRRQDLSGERHVPPLEDRPNVLLVLLEGVSHDASVSDVMDGFRDIAAGALNYTSFVAEQKQTHRGLFAIVCGSYPNFVARDAKSDIVGVVGADQACLPRLFGDQGYRTVFMQSAPLGFMRKDRFAEKTGYDEIVGQAAYVGARESSRWGIDDLSFFEYAIDKIDALDHESDPWFLTLLTSGTHHPYTVPDVGPAPTREEAFAYADDAFAWLFRRLEDGGHLDRTVVIVTADEASYPAGESLTYALSMNHIPLLVFLPEPYQPAVNEELFTQSDLRISLADLLGFETTGLTGRSLFRRYDTTRETLFGNVYIAGMFAYVSGGRLFACAEGLASCLAYEATDGLFGGTYARSFASSAEVDRIRGAVAESDRRSSDTIYFEEGREYEAKQILLGEHQVTVRPGERISWSVRAAAIDRPSTLRFAAIGYRSEQKENGDVLFQVERTIEAEAVTEFDFSYSVPESVRWILSFAEVESDEGGRTRVERLAIQRE